MYEQPRVPQPQGSMTRFIGTLVSFLKANTMDTWKAVQNLDKRIRDIQKRLDALEGK